MEARVAKLETNVEHIAEMLREVRADAREFRTDLKEMKREQERDFRLLFGAIIATALGLAGIMAKGFGWL